ncbi:MAG: signal peptidase I [Thermodesulfobacteriota bacterium]
MPHNEEQKKSTVREYAEAIVIALVLAMFIRTFVVQAFKIPSGSMIPTLLIGDHILVNKFIYGIKNPFNGKVLIPVREIEREDVIVFEYPVNPDQDFIKRVIGLPGDKVRISDKQVFVNDQPVEVDGIQFTDPRIFPAEVNTRDNFGPVVVPEDSLFVLGDNRDNSYDSRFWKFVRKEAVKGKAFILYWSWNSDDFAVRWSRLGHLIH